VRTATRVCAGPCQWRSASIATEGLHESLVDLLRSDGGVESVAGIFLREGLHPPGVGDVSVVRPPLPTRVSFKVKRWCLETFAVADHLEASGVYVRDFRQIVDGGGSVIDLAEEHLIMAWAFVLSRGHRDDGSTMADIVGEFPPASRDQLKALLKELKHEGRAHSIGRTRGARWYPGAVHE
jgi:hypothetical protein